MITLLGNCQLHRLQYVMDINGFTEYEYFANYDDPNLGYDVDLALERVVLNGVTLAQPVLNRESPLHYEKLRALNGNILFVPYLFVDGVYSLSGSGPLGSPLYGQERVQQLLVEQGIDAVINRFRNGEIDFGNVERFENSVAELQRREAGYCDLVMSDVILSEIKSHNLLATHNHPSTRLFDVFCSRVFKLLDLPYRPMSQRSHSESVVYAFSRTPRVFSPYDVENLGLRYPPDEQWFVAGHEILTHLAAGLEAS